MDPQHLLDELCTAARKLGLQVRIEAFETPPLHGGGRCRLRGRDLVLIDAGASVPEQATALASALGGFDLESVYLTPAARRAIEASRARTPERETRPDGEPAAGQRPLERVPLEPLTTMRVGGPARFMLDARSADDAARASRWAGERGVPLLPLGGGSNLVVAAAGVDALVLRIRLRGVEWRERGRFVEVAAAAGEPWDELVASAVARGLGGIECLSGIPGLVGATPIQNVGAYGQELSQVTAAVRAFDRQSSELVELAPADCGFAYRDSRFKSREPGRFLVLGVTLLLERDARPAVRYAELARELEARGLGEPGLADVRDAVLELRARKAMLLDPRDPDGRSCGSFFTNPIVDADRARAIAERAGAAPPSWPERDGRVKLAAAWLIERAGFTRGERLGAVGLSSRHALAIVCHDGARARDVIALARRIRDGVESRFGVRLIPEPVLWGFGELHDGLPA